MLAASVSATRLVALAARLVKNLDLNHQVVVSSVTDSRRRSYSDSTTAIMPNFECGGRLSAF